MKRLKIINNILKNPAFQRLKKDVGTLIDPYWKKVEPTYNEYFEKALDWFDYLPGTKRKILVISSLSVMVVIWYVIIFAPIRSERKDTLTKVESVDKTIRTLEQSEKRFMLSIKKNPNKKLQDEIDAIQKDIDKERTKLAVYTADQKSTARMVQVIKNNLAQNDSVHLLRIASIPEIRVLPPAIGTTRIGLENLPQLYSYPIELDVEGDYFNTLNFLRSLEQSWRIYWDSVEYSVTRYPKAKITIRVHLLSDAEVWDEE